MFWVRCWGSGAQYNNYDTDPVLGAMKEANDVDVITAAELIVNAS